LLYGPFFHDHDDLLSSSKVASDTTVDMIDESIHWLDRLLQDIKQPGSAWERNQRNGFQGNDNHDDVALDSSYS